MKNVETLSHFKNINNVHEIENSILASSAVIQARFNDDVIGVNRYKHFYRLILNIFFITY